MAKPHGELTDAELSVMHALWRRGDGATIREIVLEMYGRHEHSLRAGVKSLLDRLIEKGFARADERGFAHKFHAAVSREAYVGRQLEQIAESHFGGALAPMLLTLAGKAKLRP